MKASDFFCPKFIAGAMVSLAISAAGYALILKPYHDVSLREAVVSANVVSSYYAIKDPINTPRLAVDKALGQGSGAAYFVQTRILIEDEMKAKGVTSKSTAEERSKIDLSKVDALLLDSVNVLTDVQLHQYLNADAARFDLLARLELFGSVDPLPEHMPDYFITTASGLSKDDQARLTECRALLNKKVSPLYVALHSDASGMCKQPEPGKAIPAS
jgi:hypothetical protein